MIEINNCPSTLATNFSTYSPTAIEKVFDNEMVSHILPYESYDINEDETRLFIRNKNRISLSGVQTKYSMIVKDGELNLTPTGVQGRYILKPKPADILHPYDCSANENLTMQIAEQVFNIETAPNALCFYGSGEIAYITKRFDITADGKKLRVEDFASLAGLTSEKDGADYKYNYSYEEVADLIKKALPSWQDELIKFYRLILFNFLFSNGDAHLKNFSILDFGDNDLRLTPAYDMLNTRIHVEDTDFALDKGLFKDDKPEYFKGGKANGATFKQFGLQIGLSEDLIDKELSAFTAKHPLIVELINNSFLTEKIKRQYKQLYQTKRNRLEDRKL